MRARFLLPVLFVALVASACGGGGSAKASASGSSTTSTTTARNATFQKYRDCLAQHGVTLPAGTGQRRQQQGPPPTDGGTPPPSTPRTLPAGVDQQTFDAAQQACASLRPQGGFGGGGVRDSAAFRAYASCLADHGVTVTTTPAANGQQARPRFDRNDPKFAAANQTCMALLPQPSTTTTTVKQ